MIFSVWMEPRYKKESDSSKVFPFVFHITDEFSHHSSHKKICISSIAHLVRVFRDPQSWKSL